MVNLEADEIFSGLKRLHFIGIGGSGMCPIVEILHSTGNYIITGSDVDNESDTVKRIRAMGIPVAIGHRPENIGDAELLVYSAAIQKDNPELLAAKKSGIHTFERSVMLGVLCRVPKYYCCLRHSRQNYKQLHAGTDSCNRRHRPHCFYRRQATSYRR
jgi:UDP-N-acetylmuramate--alanine ligase